MKKSIFDEQTSKALKKWHAAVKKKKGEKLGKSSIRNLGGSTIGSTKPSSGPALHRFKTTGHSTRSSTFVAGEDGSDLEAEPLAPLSSTNELVVTVDHDEQQSEENESYLAEETPKEGDITFVKPEPLEGTMK